MTAQHRDRVLDTPTPCKLVRDGRVATEFNLTNSDVTDKFTSTRLNFERGMYLTDLGFYGLACQPCHGCLPLRINMANFGISKSQQKVLDDNSDLTITMHDGFDDLTFNFGRNEYIGLRERYDHSRPFISPGQHDYTDFRLMEMWPGLRPGHVDARDAQGRLVAVNIASTGDRLVYMPTHFYDPTRNTMAGRFTIVKSMPLFQHTVDHMYNGPWSPLSPHSDWKANIRGAEVLMDESWTPLTDELRKFLRADLSARYARIGQP